MAFFNEALNAPSELQALVRIPFDLKEGFVKIGSEIVHLINTRKNVAPKLAEFQDSLNVAEEKTNKYYEYVQRFRGHSIVEVPLCQDNINSCLARIGNLRRNCETLHSSTVKFTNYLYPDTFIDEEVTPFQEELETLLANLENVHQQILDLQKKQSDAVQGSSSIGSIRYKPQNPLITVDPNPPAVYIDFSDEQSHEYQFKNAILEGHIDVVGAVAVGLGGVGKTSAIRAIGRDDEIASRFSGGVFYTSLGKDARSSDLIQEISRFVEDSGNYPDAVKISAKTDLKEAAIIASRWFQNHACLFLIDDIWCRNDIPRSVTRTLSKLAVNPGSRIAFTTRDRNVEIAAEGKIVFQHRKDADAKTILLHCAKLSFPKSLQGVRNFKAILERCNGLPIALNIAGSLVCAKKDEYDVADQEQVWSDTNNHLQTRLLDYLHPDNDRTLRDLLLISVDALKSEPWSVSYLELFKTFSVIQKRQKFPVQVLTKIWNVSDDDAEKYIENFKRFSIVETCNVTRQKCIMVHDLIIDIATELAKDQIQSFALRFIKSYEPDEQAPAPHHTSFKKERKWSFFCNCFNPSGSSNKKSFDELSCFILHKVWTSPEFNDKFASKNIFRFLKMAKMEKDGLHLLLDSAWLKKQFTICGRAQIENDISIIVEFVESNPSFRRAQRKQYLAFLNVLRVTLIDCENLCDDLSACSSLWFQIYGRMDYFAEHNSVIKSFLKDVDQNARPWIKPLLGALPKPDISTKRRFDMRNVLHVASGEHFFWTIQDSEQNNGIILHYYNQHEEELMQIDEMVIPGESKPKYVDITPDGTFLVVGTEKVVFWVERNTRQGTGVNVSQIHESNIKIHCVTLCQKKPIVVIGLFNGNIQVLSLLKSGWNSAELQGHSCWVESVAISVDGNRIVSGSEDETLRVWDEKKGNWSSCEPLRHTSAVSSVAISVDGNRVLSGSDDRTIRVWDYKNGNWNSTELQGHISKVTSVSISVNGHQCVSGSHIGVVRVWDYTNGGWKSTELQGHSSIVGSVAISADGHQFISVSYDDTVRVWDYTNGSRKSTGIECHSGMVTSIDISIDGHRVVSVSYYETVQVWDYKHRSWSSTQLQGQIGKVESVKISVDGKRIIASSHSMESCTIWILENGRWIRATESDRRDVNSDLSGSSQKMEYGEIPNDTLGRIRNDEYQLYHLYKSYLIRSFIPPYVSFLVED